ncbi:phosphopantetheine-binding protein [Kineococcus sp. NPDC059986]|uniref:phosphopantetheine-binding protein n=1 Tax=Kineococcus sp. NPDC059986 TaxID=3155538 RepID=UPI00344E20A6
MTPPETPAAPAWDGRFEDVLRDVVPGAGPLVPGTRLGDRGLDSMASVALLLRLEEAYDVRFPDEHLSAATFATAGSLWSVVSALRTQR